PGKFHWRHIAASGKIVMNHGSVWISFLITLGGTRFHAHWRLQLQHSENRIETVRAHIAQSATAKIRPSPPHKWRINMVIRTLWRWPQPQVPIQTIWYRFCFFGTIKSLRPEWTARPIMDLTNRPDSAIPNPFTKLARRF